MSRYDAIVVGAGPNGLAAAITLARAGRAVLLREANDRIGGAVRSAELTLPGFIHDPFSAVYPLGVGSPLFRTLPLQEHGLEWDHPDAPLAHPLDDGRAAVLERSITATEATLGPDGSAYRSLMEPFARNWDALSADALAPLHFPRHPLLLARFGLQALRSAEGVVNSRFRGEAARVLFAGIAGHSGLPLDSSATAAFGLVLAAAGHAVGWPIPRGGAERLAEALASYFRSLGGEIVTGAPVHRLDELDAPTVLFDLTPRQVLRIAGDDFSRFYRYQLRRFRYGAGVFKLDWALDGPIPWTAAECGRAGTIHLGGTYAEIAESERRPMHGLAPGDRPFVLLAQPSLIDPTRAPAGKHTAWAYCHVPNGSRVDMTERIEAQVERFAPGFRDLILARSVQTPSDLESRNANLVGGDVNGGAAMLGQLFFRPALRFNPYRTSNKNIYFCSASTPPGGGVHGMCGYHAARAVLGARGGTR